MIKIVRTITWNSQLQDRLLHVNGNIHLKVIYFTSCLGIKMQNTVVHAALYLPCSNFSLGGQEGILVFEVGLSTSVTLCFVITAFFPF